MRFENNVLVKPVFVGPDEFEKIKGMFTNLEEDKPYNLGNVKTPDDLRWLQSILTALCIDPNVCVGADMLPGVIRVFAIAKTLTDDYPNWTQSPQLGQQQVVSVIDTGVAGSNLQHFFAVEQSKKQRANSGWNPGHYGHHVMSGPDPQMSSLIMSMPWRIEFILETR